MTGRHPNRHETVYPGEKGSGTGNSGAAQNPCGERNAPFPLEVR